MNDPTAVSQRLRAIASSSVSRKAGNSKVLLHAADLIDGSGVIQGDKFQVGHCIDSECHLPHIQMIDTGGKVVAQIAVSRENLDKVLEYMKSAMWE